MLSMFSFCVLHPSACKQGLVAHHSRCCERFGTKFCSRSLLKNGYQLNLSLSYNPTIGFIVHKKIQPPGNQIVGAQFEREQVKKQGRNVASFRCRCSVSWGCLMFLCFFITIGVCLYNYQLIKFVLQIDQDRAQFTYLIQYWVECMMSSVISFTYFTHFSNLNI